MRNVAARCSGSRRRWSSNRLGERFDAAVGTSTEFGAYVRLRAAGDQVTAREAWVNWVDDEGYRGLNAGPFELLAESRATRFY